MPYKTRPYIPFTRIIPNPFLLYVVGQKRLSRLITPMFTEGAAIDGGSWGLTENPDAYPNPQTRGLNKVFSFATNTGDVCVRTRNGEQVFRGVINRSAFIAAVRGESGARETPVFGEAEPETVEPAAPEIELSDKICRIPFLPADLVTQLRAGIGKETFDHLRVKPDSIVRRGDKLVSYGKQTDYMIENGKSGSILCFADGVVTKIENDYIEIQISKDYENVERVPASYVYGQIMDVIQERIGSAVTPEGQSYLSYLEGVRIPVFKTDASDRLLPGPDSTDPSVGL